ncbi:MAG TPA: CDP-diacylglycerol--glycerol-3-phosphate 3-phosphatidyltransferase [Candidatus Kapabacteria bacterium]|jgi:CDP-diacylglycerol--glycerol-3-phosphate 3-phosphatidyltransferase|nr:CDP-diacylglycerol--glycerol-3-phosphate 3-phosphatidyltransferase [Candidatus Kapabacteria bacterium]HPU23486.1 CDP-diacylglycerol--glycerol-3-phosphate 3-phosphatidyltransferase [Candidatus Kapabacteria bacterium]
MIKKLPNILTFFRALAAPLFFVLFLSNNRDFILLAGIVFVLAAITDFFDGYLARKMNATSEWGAFADPLADKFLTTSVFIAFVIVKIVPLWMVAIILLRDFSTTFLRLVKISNKKIKTSYTAKIKTTLQMIFIFVVLSFKISTFYLKGDVASNIRNIIFSDYVYYSMLIITIISLISLIEYIYQLLSPKIDV